MPNDDAVGPVIVWENYGVEGWRPQSFKTIKEALLQSPRYQTDFVITRKIDFEVLEKTLCL